MRRSPCCMTALLAIVACGVHYSAATTARGRASGRLEPILREPLHPSLTYAVEQIMVLGDMEPMMSDAAQHKGCIPCILHHINLGLPEDASNGSEADAKEASQDNIDSCRHHHRHWAQVDWDQAAIQALLYQRYSDLIETYMRLRHPAMRADLAKFMVLHTFGGLILDREVECFRPTDSMLQGAHIVLQGTAFDGATSLAMASAPGVTFWEQQLASIRLRSHAGALVEDVPRLTSDWSLVDLLADTLKLGDNFWSGRVGIHTVDGVLIRVWGQGSWFCPCFLNAQCYHDVWEKKKTGQLEQHVTGMYVFMPHISESQF